MKWNWKKIATGLKIALNVAVSLEAAKVIKVKHLGEVKSVADAIAASLPKRP